MVFPYAMTFQINSFAKSNALRNLVRMISVQYKFGLTVILAMTLSANDKIDVYLSQSISYVFCSYFLDNGCNFYWKWLMKYVFFNTISNAWRKSESYVSMLLSCGVKLWSCDIQTIVAFIWINVSSHLRK